MEWLPVEDSSEFSLQKSEVAEGSVGQCSYCSIELSVESKAVLIDVGRWPSWTKFPRLKEISGQEFSDLYVECVNVMRYVS